MAETNSEMWLDQTLRISTCGTWWSASTANGPPLGLLQLEPDLVTEPAARERVAAVVSAVRAINPPGVLRTTELVFEARRAWLVVATMPTPTLADVLAHQAQLPAGAASAIAVDIAAALHELHAGGLSHGHLVAETVVVTASGGASLVEVGVLAAVRDLPSDVGRDVHAWACLVRDLANYAAAPETDLLLSAAAMAESGDLASAAHLLAAEANPLADFAERESLAALTRGVKPAAPRTPAQRSTMDGPANGIRVRFGRGVPPAAIQAARARAAQPAPRRRGRALVLTLALLVILLGGAASAWWFLFR